jgi:hypothetical protein
MAENLSFDLLKTYNHGNQLRHGITPPKRKLNSYFRTARLAQKQIKRLNPGREQRITFKHVRRLIKNEKFIFEGKSDKFIL